VALVDRSSRPRRLVGKTEPAREKMVLKLRELRMTGPVIAHRLRMPRATVSRILRRNGQAKLRAPLPPEPIVRYERSRAGELVPRRREEACADHSTWPSSARRPEDSSRRRRLGVRDRCGVSPACSRLVCPAQDPRPSIAAPAAD